MSRSSAFNADVIEQARQAVTRGQMTVTLVASEGSRFRLRDVGKLCTGMDRLMAAVTKELDAKTRVEWCVTAVGLVDDRLAITFGGFAPPKRTKAPQP